MIRRNAELDKDSMFIRNHAWWTCQVEHRLLVAASSFAQQLSIDTAGAAIPVSVGFADRVDNFKARVYVAKAARHNKLTDFCSQRLMVRCEMRRPSSGWKRSTTPWRP